MKTFLVIVLTISTLVHKTTNAMPVAGAGTQAPPVVAPQAPAMPSVGAASAMPVTGTTPQVVPQAVTIPQQIQPGTAVAQPKTESHKELQNTLHALEQAKKELTKLLSELDEKLLDARKQAAEAKTLSFGLLEKTSEAEAKSDYEKIRAANQQVKDAQQFISSEFTKNFNEKVSVLREQATKADTLLKTLSNESTKAPPASPIPNPSVKKETEPPTIVAAKHSQPTTDADSTGLVDSLSSGIAYVVTGFKNLLGIAPAPTKKKKLEAHNLGPIPENPKQRSDEAAVMVQQIDQTLKTLDATRSTVQQYLLAINQSTQYIEKQAEQTATGKKLLNESKGVKKRLQDTPAAPWKRVILAATSKILDMIGYLANTLVELFNKTVGQFTRTLIQDVQKKVATDNPTK